MRHTLSILVENRFGELARIVGLFSARGYNIESLTVAETLDQKISRVTLVTSGDDQTVAQITKQLDKQIRVLSVTNLTALDHIEREMALIHVNAVGGNGRQQVMHLVDIFRARVVDVSENALTIETTGDRSKVNALLGLLAPFGVQEMVRAGTVAIPRLPGATTNHSLVQEFAVT
ncbi:MAG: acetolactate synthase small subunit [Pyrinomonadaceae bacterium]